MTFPVFIIKPTIFHRSFQMELAMFFIQTKGGLVALHVRLASFIFIAFHCSFIFWHLWGTFCKFDKSMDAPFGQSWVAKLSPVQLMSVVESSEFHEVRVRFGWGFCFSNETQRCIVFSVYFYRCLEAISLEHTFLWY